MKLNNFKRRIDEGIGVSGFIVQPEQLLFRQYFISDWQESETGVHPDSDGHGCNIHGMNKMLRFRFCRWIQRLYSALQQSPPGFSEIVYDTKKQFHD